MMRKSMIIILTVISLALAGSFTAQMQEPRAKDMFIEHGRDDTQGRRGAKVAIVRKRNGTEEVVSPNDDFKSGDQLRLVFNINFDGYLVIVNQGTSGNRHLLFPYRAADGRLVSNRISRTNKLTIPGTRTNDWITLDNQTGNEIVTVTFSPTQISEIAAPPTAAASGEVAGNRPDGQDSPATAQEEQDLISRLGKSFDSRSKDMFVQSDTDGMYAVAPPQLINEPLAFSFTLKHK